MMIRSHNIQERIRVYQINVRITVISSHDNLTKSLSHRHRRELNISSAGSRIRKAKLE